MFAAFILWCGLTHIVNLVTLWYPIYEVQGAVKAVTAAISATTAVAIFFLIPRALAIPSPNELQIANRRLASEIEANQETLRQLKGSRDELEVRVHEGTRELQELSTRFQRLFQHAPVAMLMADQLGRIKQVNSAATSLFGYQPHELVDRPVEFLLPEDVGASHRGLRNAYMKDPLARPMGVGRELYARNGDGKKIPVEIGLNLMEIAGATYVVASIADISERRQRDEQNSAASARSQSQIKKHARRGPGDCPPHRLCRPGRLHRALSGTRARPLGRPGPVDRFGLARCRSCGLIRSQLAHLQDLVGDRITLSGPPLHVSAQAAQTIGMALHELATNAGKYGALSTSDGKVEIRWRLGPSADGKRFIIEWQESGGPVVSAPSRRGFGMTVLERMAERGLSAIVKLDFGLGGLKWHLDCPVQKVLDDSSGIDYGLETSVSDRSGAVIMKIARKRRARQADTCPFR